MQNPTVDALVTPVYPGEGIEPSPASSSRTELDALVTRELLYDFDETIGDGTS